jgi:hypothetical protein
VLEKGILTQLEFIAYQNYFRLNRNVEERADERFVHRNRYFVGYSNQGTKNRKIDEILEEEKNDDDGEVEERKEKVGGN